MPAFDKRIRDFEAANTQVLGISTDSPFSHENWAKSVNISHYPLLSDIQRSVVKDYGVYWADWNANSRATFVVDKQGKVRFVERYGTLRASPFARSATGVFLSRVVSATPTRTSAPPATSHPVSPSLRSVVASTTPTTGWKFMKTAERLGPTTLTARYHHT